MNEDRLNAFEKMLSAILAQYDSDAAKLAALKAEGKEKTATYRQLFAKKMQYQTILSYYRAYGLLEEDEKS
ncbi:MAG: hypothetical protein PUA52_08615 [Lachnospiraceae bacterium]|nr:hypothetical protein [Lachnospiraceae bacterium]